MKGYVTRLVLLIGMISCSVEALTYREVGMHSWRLVNGWFPCDQTRNALALYGYYNRELEADDKDSVVARKELPQESHMGGLYKILQGLDLCSDGERLSDHQINNLVISVCQELTWINGKALAVSSGETIEHWVQYWMDLNMMQLLSDFICQACSKSRSFKDCFDQYQKSNMKSDQDPLSQAKKLCEAGVPLEKLEETEAFVVIADRVSKRMFEVDLPVKLLLVEYKDVKASPFLVWVPAYPNF